MPVQAVGWFLSHGGQGAVNEAITTGVPMSSFTRWTFRLYVADERESSILAKLFGSAFSRESVFADRTSGN